MDKRREVERCSVIGSTQLGRDHRHAIGHIQAGEIDTTVPAVT